MLPMNNVKVILFWISKSSRFVAAYDPFDHQFSANRHNDSLQMSHSSSVRTVPCNVLERMMIIVALPAGYMINVGEVLHFVDSSNKKAYLFGLTSWYQNTVFKNSDFTIYVSLRYQDYKQLYQSIRAVEILNRFWNWCLRPLSVNLRSHEVIPKKETNLNIWA